MLAENLVKQKQARVVANLNRVHSSPCFDRDFVLPVTAGFSRDGWRWIEYGTGNPRHSVFFEL
jgi:hypothetical protein